MTTTNLSSPEAIPTHAPTRWRPGLRGREAPQSRRQGLWAILGQHRGSFAASVGIEWLSKGATLAAGIGAAALVGFALAGRAGAVWPWLAVLVGLVVGKAIAAWTATLLSHRLAFRVLAEIRHWVYWALERSAPTSMINFRGGDVLARTMGDTEALEVFYAHAVVNACVGVTLPLVVVVFVGVTGGWILAGILVAGLVLAGVIPVALITANIRQGTQVRDRTADVANRIAESVDGMREVLLFGQEHAQREDILRASRRLARAQHRYRSRGAAEIAAGQGILGVTTVVIAALGVRRVGADSLDPAWLPAVVMGSAAAFSPVADLVSGARVSGLLAAAARRLFDILRLRASVPDHGVGELRGTGGLAVRLDDVSFRYPGSDRTVLDRVNFSVTPGETVALVGRSGAGKSTVAHLLLRWWDPCAGEITFDRTPLPELAYAQITEHVAYVPQDVFLFHDTLRANLTLATPDVSEDELCDACERGRLSPVLETLDEGLDTVVGQRGARLSGGERQRVAIARALLRRARLLILDESSSQLDPISEREIQAALNQDRGERTTVVIAHRLTTILAADRVVLLDAGQVIDTGSHAELLGRCAAYAELVSPQLVTSHGTAAVPDLARDR